MSNSLEGLAKVSEKAAGYMELAGAKKDAGCELVNVRGGVSSHKGCCNLFDPEDDADHFSCGHCEYVERGEKDV